MRWAWLVYLASPAWALEVETLHESGPPENRIDLIILGDGYQSVDQEQFSADAANLTNDLFQLEPYATFQDMFNVKAIHVISANNGADNGAYGATRDTALGAYFYCYGIDRLLCVDDAAVLQTAAANTPEYDFLLVLVNDPTYGGSGGAIAVASLESTATEIVRHELGHSIANLADEYEDPYPGFPACQWSMDCPEPNATLYATRESVKWKAWIASSTPVPTPEYSVYGDVIGLFEGCRYASTDLYRPSENSCLMKFLGEPLCAVCQEGMALKFWSLVSAIENDVASLSAGGCEPVTVTAELADIGGITLDYAWTVDGEPVEEMGPALEIAGGSLEAGVHEVSLTSHITMSFVRTDREDVLSDSFTWQLTIESGESGETNACGGVCTLDTEVGIACDGTDVDTCLDDEVVCDGTNNTVCATGEDNLELCNQLDDDCDGQIDEGDNGCGGVCTVEGVAGAACDGGDADLCLDDVYVCDGVQAVTCELGADNAESCNSVDDDCDSLVDEGDNVCGGVCKLEELTFGAACDGPDTDLCEDDTIVCGDLNTLLCSLGEDNEEACDDEQDDDCDGQVDEDCGGAGPDGAVAGNDSEPDAGAGDRPLERVQGSSSEGGGCSLSAHGRDPAAGPPEGLVALFVLLLPLSMRRRGH